MNIETGEIKQFAELSVEEKTSGKWVPMAVDPSPKQSRMHKVGRNETCPCGSGKKFKHCHLTKRPAIIVAGGDTAPKGSIQIFHPDAVRRLKGMPVMAQVWCPAEIREEVKKQLLAIGQTLVS